MPAPAKPDTVFALVEHQAAARPEAVYALGCEDGRQLDFATLRTRCREVAALLDRAGVAAGATVACVLPNGLQTLLLLLGSMYSGRCVNPVNLLSQPEQMRYVLEHSDCALVFVSPDWEARVRALLDGIARPIALRVLDPAADRIAGIAEAPAGADGTDLAEATEVTPPAPGATALLMYTSGTTGRPKGVMLSQANLAANAQAIGAEHGLGPADRVLGVLPLYHINAFAVTMLAPLAHGGSVAIAPRFSATAFWAQVQAQRCSWINVVPTIVSFLLEGQDPPPGATAALRFCRSASAALPPEHLRGFEHRFGIGVIETMGLTETVAPAFSNPLEPAQRKLGAVGRASGCEARVVDADLQPLPDGASGEITVRGPNVMRGYYKNPEATAAAFTPDGWLRTGDLGHRDADGFFFVTGRIKELIIKGGENIAPREIDEVLLQHPAVRDAAAVGVPDKHYGQEILACVVLREGSGEPAALEAALRAFCLERLGRYKTPARFRFVAELPRGPSGKVQRLKLAA
ncbi:MAG TPA: AMP-binding protein [Pseudorhodoferax sp.]|nr:AMP-binding protein [Pseudorhodoferax sp.]